MPDTPVGLNSVQLFEIEIAKFFGSPYAVATDCCTHAVELCLRLKKHSKYDLSGANLFVHSYDIKKIKYFLRLGLFSLAELLLFGRH
jgi:DegT/DnrJ/EryC1/StrS aminotransferase family